MQIACYKELHSLAALCTQQLTRDLGMKHGQSKHALLYAPSTA